MPEPTPLPLEYRSQPEPGPKLARNMGLFALIVYGVGDMVGSGIYATIGDAARQVGNAVWIAFLVSMVAAMLTGLSYASIASRYPRAAGAAYVTHHAFRFAFLSYLVGLAVAASGLTSMATNTRKFSGVLAEMTGLTKGLGALRFSPGGVPLVDIDVAVLLIGLGFLAFLTFVNFWGIRQSMWANMVCTAVEIGGLLFVIALGVRFWGGGVNYLETPRAGFDPATGAMVYSGLSTSLLLSASVLTFFAFIGFEDMLNVSEEVKDAERTVPRGMVAALLVVAVLYISVAITAVSVVGYKQLAAAEAPLEAVTARTAPWLKPWVYKVLTMFAVANTVLLNYVMGSRLLYGMARQGLVPRPLGRVHSTRHTPHIAILTLLVVVVVLVLSGTVSDLATSTGLLLLVCFMIVNGALIVLKLRPGEPRGRFEVPLLVPALGILVNGTLVVARVMDGSLGRKGPLIALGICVVIGLLYVVMRPKHISEQSLAAAEHEAEA